MRKTGGKLVTVEIDEGRYRTALRNFEAPGGCFTAHNVLDGFRGVEAFLDYVRSRPGYETTIERTSRSGISVSCKAR